MELPRDDAALWVDCCYDRGSKKGEPLHGDVVQKKDERSCVHHRVENAE